VNKVVSVIGLGYVGLPLAVLAASNEYDVIGIDTDEKKINLLNQGISPVEDVSEEEMKLVINGGSLEFSSDFSKVSQSKIVIICVPTPLDKNRQPDYSYLLNAIESIGSNLSRDTLIILESTVEPGTTREILLPYLEKHSNLNRKDFLIAYSPERIDPLNKNWNIVNTPKIVAGLTEVATKSAFQFYSKFVKSIFVCDTPEVAELAKLLENSFRFVNISFINELSMLCQVLGVDINQVIKAASTKPYGFMPFYPSIGVGGHCIPVDPLYLAKKFHDIGSSSRFIELADTVNLSMPGYFVSRAEAQLGSLMGKKIMVVGVSYKPNVSDVRETPVASLIQGLQERGAVVSWHDDLVKVWKGELSTLLSNEYDLAILATPHDYLDLTRLGSVPVLDTRNSI
jgi:UDP-N-acetyl-D-glucosamine dehydrogenase